MSQRAEAQEPRPQQLRLQALYPRCPDLQWYKPGRQREEEQELAELSQQERMQVPRPFAQEPQQVRQQPQVPRPPEQQQQGQPNELRMAPEF
ncbi:MAG: hypothetical protein ABS95_03360 [Verrucomicrobia bacterium SCN 57-15]|nr:MAG: hypothetical protein ABS95_03360 [Verrucomicrobia bacterium SCN 57-15]